jgi:hypothetical protein
MRATFSSAAQGTSYSSKTTGGLPNSFGSEGASAAPNKAYIVAQNEVGGSVTNGPCGYAPYPPCKMAENACILLTAEGVSAVSGQSWTQQGSGPMRPLAGAPLINDCQYDGPTEDEDVEIRVHEGGRAQFDETVFKIMGGVTPVGGVGDTAYKSSKQSNVREMWVIKDGIFFSVTLHSDNPNVGSWVVVLARKAAGRIKTK